MLSFSVRKILKIFHFSGTLTDAITSGLHNLEIFLVSGSTAVNKVK
jgi:hypothetical protein